MGDVGPDSRPIWRQITIAYPGLQIRGEGGPRWDDRLRRRQPQKIPARQLHLRAEEIMIRRQCDRRAEGYREGDLLSCRRTCPPGEVVRDRMYAVHPRVEGRR